MSRMITQYLHIPTHTPTRIISIHPSIHPVPPKGIVAMSRFGSDVVCYSFMTSREDREQSIPTDMSYCFFSVFKIK